MNKLARFQNGEKTAAYQGTKFIINTVFLQSMMRWKWMPGFLYQMEDEGKRARQRRDREKVCVRDRALLEERDSVGK
jgi:hypothetical protein